MNLFNIVVGVEILLMVSKKQLKGGGLN